MSDNEYEPFQDELEVEIIDLDRESEDSDEGSTSSLPSRLSLRSRLSPGQRVSRLAVTCGVVGLTLFVILGHTLPVQSGVFGLPSFPTSTLEPGSDLFYFDTSPSWGELFLDGRPLAHPPRIGADRPLQLAQGRHLLIWRARPFRPLSCFISVPVTPSDTCLYTLAVQERFDPMHPDTKAGWWVLLFYESLNALDSTRRTALIQEVQAVLDTQQSTETVYPGERYVYIQQQYTLGIATQQLRARLRFQLDTVKASNCVATPETCTIHIPSGPSQNCLLFCTQPDQFDYGVQGWHSLVVVHAVWDYATLDGRIIAHDQPDVLPTVTELGHFVAVQITWDGENWHVVLVHHGLGGNDLACLAAGDAMSNPLSSIQNGAFALFFTAAPVGAEGCLVAIQTMSSTPSTPFSTHSSMAYCLYRFGLLLAANDRAHEIWPHMLLADGYERNLAQQLAASIIGNQG